MKLLRYLSPEKGRVFLVMPFGAKRLSTGEDFDFEELHEKSLVPAIESRGLVSERADDIYGPPAVMDRIWRGIQRADVVVVVFSGRAPNVALEFGMALLLGKRMIILAHDLDDVPSDVRGLYHVILFSSHWTDMQRMTAELGKQLVAISDEPATEMALIPMGGDGSDAHPVPATVEAVHDAFVVVHADDGRRGILSTSDVTYSKILKDMHRFSVGQRLQGAFIPGPRGESRYTLLAGDRDPWGQLAKSHPVGHRFISTIHSVREGLGAFVRVDEGINGLVPARTITFATDLQSDMQVEVEMVSLDAERRRAQLRLLRIVETPSIPVGGPGSEPLRTGHQLYGRIVKMSPEEDGHQGGFLVLELPNKQRGILHFSKMTQELRHDLNNGLLELDEEIFVAVSRIDPTRGRVELREIEEPEEEQSAAA